MSYRIKVPPKSIPLDEAHLGTWGDRLLHVLEDNRRAVLAGVAVIIAAAGIVGGILWYDGQRTEGASHLLQRATSLSLASASDKPSEENDITACALRPARRYNSSGQSEPARSTAERTCGGVEFDCGWGTGATPRAHCIRVDRFPTFTTKGRPLSATACHPLGWC